MSILLQEFWHPHSTLSHQKLIGDWSGNKTCKARPCNMSDSRSRKRVWHIMQHRRPFSTAYWGNPGPHYKNRKCKCTIKQTLNQKCRVPFSFCSPTSHSKMHMQNKKKPVEKKREFINLPFTHGTSTRVA